MYSLNPNKIPGNFFTLADGSQHDGVPLETLESPTMLAGYAPSALTVVKQLHL
jgi:hypothetical protein